MAQGMRQGTFLLSPKMKGKDEEKEGAAWTAGNPIFPIGLLPSNPKMPVNVVDKSHYMAALAILFLRRY